MFRRECLALFLTTSDEILNIFDIGEDYNLEDIQWVMVLNSLLSGVEGLTLYIERAKAWCYSHCLARFIFLSFALSLDDGPFSFDTDAKSGCTYIKCDRTKIANFINLNVKSKLEILHRCRLNGDLNGAMELIQPLTEVTTNFLDLQKVLKKMGRKFEVIFQETPYIKDNKLLFTKHDKTRAGVVETICENYWKNHEYLTHQILQSFSHPP